MSARMAPCPYPSLSEAGPHRNAVFCLWESNSMEERRAHADAVMGESSENSHFEVNAEIARGLPQPVTA